MERQKGIIQRANDQGELIQRQLAKDQGGLGQRRAKDAVVKVLDPKKDTMTAMILSAYKKDPVILASMARLFSEPTLVRKP